MARLSFNGKRIIAAVILFICLLAVANLYFELQLFGRFAKEMIAASFALLYLEMRFIGPTIDELREHRNAKQSRL